MSAEKKVEDDEDTVSSKTPLTSSKKAAPSTAKLLALNPAKRE